MKINPKFNLGQKVWFILINDSREIVDCPFCGDADGFCHKCNDKKVLWKYTSGTYKLGCEKKSDIERIVIYNSGGKILYKYIINGFVLDDKYIFKTKSDAFEFVDTPTYSYRHIIDNDEKRGAIPNMYCSIKQ